MGEEFLLRWNDYQAAIASMMESLCLTEEMVDCTLTAGRTSFSAHRMVLSTCSPYFRSLFASVPSHQHPVIFVRDVESSILELLVRYMYSGQVSVSEEQLVPLVQAAKSLSIKGLLDVPVQQRPASPSTRLTLPSPSLDLPPARQSEPVTARQRKAPLPSPSSSSSSSCPPPPSQASQPSPALSLPSPQQRKLPPRSSPIPASKSSEASGEGEQEDGGGEEAMEEEVEKEEEEGEGVDPTLLGDLHHTQLLRRLTSEVTAFPFPGGGEDCPTLPQSYSCEHCGKEFTSKRKHQRHVLNVHFGYNPVQCPFCNKGHRDNYNLKQHVCPVLNMKYGVFERKEGEAGGEAGAIVGRPPGSGSSLAPSQLLQAALTLAKRPDS